jgi:hypothetical protein
LKVTEFDSLHPAIPLITAQFEPVLAVKIVLLDGKNVG